MQKMLCVWSRKYYFSIEEGKKEQLMNELISFGKWILHIGKWCNVYFKTAKWLAILSENG